MQCIYVWIRTEPKNSIYEILACILFGKSELVWRYDWLNKDPFINFSAKIKPVKRECLTREELARIEGLNIGIRRLFTVRDVFVFSCCTELAYVDIENLTLDNLVSV